MKILHKLGIYGLEKEEPFIIASLITKDPLLLIGEAGSAKTLLAQRLADALSLKFHAYDASKALFEDILGFPNPAKLGEGYLDYVSTPISLWDKEFILIDEISRANPAMQSKWLEVIRSRRIMGKKLDNLKYIFAAMNPPGYLGAIPLDIALAGRFAFVIKVPSITEMDKENALKIISHLSEDDAPGFPAPHFQIKEEVKNELKELLSQISSVLPEIIKEHSEFVEEYLVNLMNELKGKELFIDGRRLGMIRRNILTVMGVYKIYDIQSELQSLIEDTVKRSLPYIATGTEVERGLITAICLNAYRSTVQKSAEISRAFFEKEFVTDNIPALEKFIHSNFMEVPFELRYIFSNMLIEKIESNQPIKNTEGFLYIMLFIKLLKFTLEQENSAEYINYISQIWHERMKYLFQFSANEKEPIFFNTLSEMLARVIASDYKEKIFPFRKLLWLFITAQSISEYDEVEKEIKRLLSSIDVIEGGIK